MQFLWIFLRTSLCPVFYHGPGLGPGPSPNTGPGPKLVPDIGPGPVIFLVPPWSQSHSCHISCFGLDPGPRPGTGPQPGKYFWSRHKVVESSSFWMKPLLRGFYEASKVQELYAHSGFYNKKSQT